MNSTVLIADGDAELRDIYRQFLLLRGFDVEAASDGLDCLEKLRRLKPAVLVLDPDLRWGGGDGILDYLREECPTHGTAVILTATAGYPLDFDAVVESPVVECLPKPFALTALLECVRSTVARKERRGSSKLNHVPRCSELFIG